MDSDLKLCYGLTQCYPKVARGAMTTVHHSSLAQEEFSKTFGPHPLANAIFSVVSIPVLYTYSAIESSINYQLYRVWQRRNDGSDESSRFSAIFGDVAAFEAPKTHKKSDRLGERIKTLCGILGYRKPRGAIRLQSSTCPSGRGMQEDERLNSWEGISILTNHNTHF
jgi:hypothetical protein